MEREERRPGSAGTEKRRTSGRGRRRRRRSRSRFPFWIAILAAAAVLLVVILAVKGCVNKDERKKAVNDNAVSMQDIQNSGTASSQTLGGSMTLDSLPDGDDPGLVSFKPNPSVDGRPDIDVKSWEFVLANSTHSIEQYEPVTDYFYGVELDYRIIPAMRDFVTDAEAEGYSVCMISGYRSYETQRLSFEDKVDEFDGDEARAATIIARPGTSEHQTGLAADITDQVYEYMNSNLQFTDLYEWMSAHCHEYGFIVRYPSGKEDITGIIFEPWHYRYVGVEAATYIMEHKLTLEEFLAMYE